MVETYCIEDYSRLKILPVFVSLAQISEHARKDSNEFRLHLNAHIVHRCIETVQTHKGNLQPDINLLKKATNSIKMLFGFDKDDKEIEAIIIKIKAIAENLMFKLQYDLTTESLRKQLGFKEEAYDQIDLQGGYKSPLGVNASSKATSRHTDSSESSEEDMLTYVGMKLSHQDATSFVLEFFKQIQVLLNIDHLLILLDECSEASYKAQVEIFRLFKAIRGARAALPNKLSLAFFIGAVYPHGETYYPNRKDDGFSFDPGQDCAMEFLQWDEIDIDTYVSFFKDMAHLRAQEILNFEGDFNSLRSFIFENEDAFLLAAYCANGIPRRFWQILKRAYDSSSEKILLQGVDAAVQEIANNQILTLGNIQEEDLEFMDYIMDILSNKNVSIRRKNNQLNNKIPQNLYFSIHRKLTKSISLLVMQGAIHDKSRMRTKRRRSIQPMYSIDIAVAHTFRIIPPKQLIDVVTKDIPKCVSNNFDQAPEIKPRTVKSFYKEMNQEEIVDKTTEGIPESYGFVKSYSPDKFGYIELDDGGPHAFFWANQVPENLKQELKSGDKVKFLIKSNRQGRQALQVELISEATENNTDLMRGQIVSYVPKKFGFIDLMDGGPNALFTSQKLATDLIYDLKEGDIVTCSMKETERGRYCFDLKKM